MGGGAIAAPPPIPGSSQMKMQFVPASHGQNTLGTDVPRIIRHDGAKNRVGRVPGTRTGAADLDYEGNVYTEKRVMWETLSPGPACWQWVGRKSVLGQDFLRIINAVTYE